jgi:Flp pilus assembly protein TadD
MHSCGNKNNTEAAEFFERGNYHFKKNEVERALELFTEAIDKVPDFADAFNNRGLCYERLGNIEKAANDYRKAVELDDSFNQAKLNLTSALIQIGGDLKESEILLNKIAPIYADSAQFYDLRGKYYIKRNETKSAIADFQKSLELAPFNLETITNLGYVFYLRKDFENAKETFLNVLSEEPDFAFALNNLSATYGQLNDWNEALKFSEKAVKKQPNEITFINTQALNLLETNEIEQATEFINKALKLQPANPYSLRNLGLLQLKREEFELAATTLQGVETMNPEVEFIYFYLGNLYEATGNISVACQMYKRGSILLDSRSLAAEKKCK